MKEIERHIRQNGLIPVMDDETSRTIYRRATELPLRSPQEIEDSLSDHLAVTRERANITKEEMAELLGLSQQFYGRAERRMAHMRVTRLILMIEILGPDMFDAIAFAAPQIFGKDETEVKARSELVSTIMKLPVKNLYEISAYVRLLAQIVQNEKYEADREEVAALKELMHKNSVSVDEMTKMVHVIKARRGPLKRGRKPRTKPVAVDDTTAT